MLLTPSVLPFWVVADCVPTYTSSCVVNTTVTTGNVTAYTLGKLDLCTVEGLPLVDTGVATGAHSVQGISNSLTTIPDNTCKADTNGVLDK